MESSDYLVLKPTMQDMNFRVALQYEYTGLGLDDCLERLGHHESDELAVQITAYVDNVVDVQDLMEEAELKQAAVDQVNDLEEELGRVKDILDQTSEKLSTERNELSDIRAR